MIVDITIGRWKLLDCSNLHAGTTPFDASLKPYISICTASNLPLPSPVFLSNHKPASGSQVGFMESESFGLLAFSTLQNLSLLSLKDELLAPAFHITSDEFQP
ncbi:hypothetical protein N7527_006952 [Penicillium freii]|nr:hypothetical protein N7527_006952 [Penicillium freii]